MGPLECNRYHCCVWIHYADQIDNTILLVPLALVVLLPATYIVVTATKATTNYAVIGVGVILIGKKANRKQAPCLNAPMFWMSLHS